MHATTYTSYPIIFKLRKKKKLMKSRYSVPSRTNIGNVYKFLVEIIMKSVELNLDQVHAYSINFQSQSFV